MKALPQAELEHVTFGAMRHGSLHQFKFQFSQVLFVYGVPDIYLLGKRLSSGYQTNN